jgi:hypothetical protein
LSGATIRDWKIDRARYVATPLMSDGREGPPLELRGLRAIFPRGALMEIREVQLRATTRGASFNRQIAALRPRSTHLRA